MAGLDKILTGAMECKVARVTYHWQWRGHLRPGKHNLTNSHYVLPWIQDKCF